ncbi:hypothetical protein [Halomonas sp. RT37]|uniref:IS66 family transposase n=1 Tax=Halomonas sp. RT37 TaxID=2950872 RepID=A0AAU7KD73_9GAMM|nr:hypothetical protein [uncultured Halomonas sp.]|tara:strand:+ start:463 stop:615 length:153 start_codon:yes stop_codon:yes gene_type:complete
MSEPSDSLLREILLEQKRTNELLALLIQALADEADPDDPPTTYLDGTPAR